ncbi:membrane fusion protein, cobalt-zinc-cadmium efflux system [Sphingopyxis sp. YR583]|jgi:cobalt-zinc-cadmium efflux system membrane fusion protein|uniref:efflux RND transporter periplasmic adaptor subunit n=1 Tax=Sphingopyxis sp. YR583 TaxID=1881047 RepID=UPI0008A785EC|nr:efflux RND transporter periplasmic adaptor subunit [Sphingopyxis sp. YR583]SEH11556.1 membrane fusion protein, cobalt-zinc-cadmium efflux system [Sphingopyxis sp. YR583]
MTFNINRKLLAAALVPLLLSACGGSESARPADEHGDDHGKEESGHAEEGRIALTAEQIRVAGITLGRPTVGSAGALQLPATIESDPQGTQAVSAAIGGRIVALNHNLGQGVGRGQTLAIIESREAAQLQGEVQATKARLALANSNLAREERLFAQRVSPEQDVIAARTAATEARIAYQLAQQQVSAAGGGGGQLNRIAIAAPISGQVISRSVVLGQTVAADAELYRIANLSSVSLSLNLQPADAGRIRPGAIVTVSAPGRQAAGKISFVSPALDPATRLVPAIAILDNRSGQWRIGEAVTASVALAGDSGAPSVSVPSTAIQTIEGKSVVFVRTKEGFEAVPVVLGDRAGTNVVVRSGLKGTEQIAITNSFALKAEIGKGEAGHED